MSDALSAASLGDQESFREVGGGKHMYDLMDFCIIRLFDSASGRDGGGMREGGEKASKCLQCRLKAYVLID